MRAVFSTRFPVACGDRCHRRSAALLAFQLLVRRVHREHERVISGVEARQLVETLYDIYRPQFRASDLAHPSLSLDSYPRDDIMIPLVPPTLC